MNRKCIISATLLTPLVDVVCGNGFCRNCHVDLTFEDCINKTWDAQVRLSNGYDIEGARKRYPNKEEK